jgi:hypothetical protein
MLPYLWYFILLSQELGGPSERMGLLQHLAMEKDCGKQRELLIVHVGYERTFCVWRTEFAGAIVFRINVRLKCRDKVGLAVSSVRHDSSFLKSGWMGTSRVNFDVVVDFHKWFGEPRASTLPFLDEG